MRGIIIFFCYAYEIRAARIIMAAKWREQAQRLTMPFSWLHWLGFGARQRLRAHGCRAARHAIISPLLHARRRPAPRRCAEYFAIPGLLNARGRRDTLRPWRRIFIYAFRRYTARLRRAAMLVRLRRWLLGTLSCALPSPIDDAPLSCPRLFAGRFPAPRRHHGHTPALPAALDGCRRARHRAGFPRPATTIPAQRRRLPGMRSPTADFFHSPALRAPLRATWALRYIQNARKISGRRGFY